MRLTTEGCRQRQRRLLEGLEEAGLEGAIIGRRDHVYYFTGFLHNRLHAAAAFIRTDGHVTLVGAGVPEDAAVDEIVPYEAGFFSTMHSVQFETVAEKLAASVGKRHKVGADMGGGSACIAALGGADAADITRDVYRLRKCKLADEVDAIRAAIGIAETMYNTAKEAIGPGADEVEVFAEVRAAATVEAGEDLEYLGNDFRSNAGGGLPRRRAMEAGELYILDAGPVLHGYFADNCRTFAVDGSPTDEQMRAWSYIDALFAQLEAAVQPGVVAREVYEIANEYLGQEGYDGLVHHLGHGVGMAPHETPELNPQYEATFEVGDVITMEPGLYSEDLKAGIRLEENYLITEDGLERLTSFPRGLV